MSFTDLFKPEYLTYTVPAAVGLAVCLVLVLVLRPKRRRSALAEAVAGKGKGGGWDAAEAPYMNRRSSQRREGAPVKVTVSSPALASGSDSGYVLDRSTGGLRLAMTAGMPPGSTLQVRACHAPDSTPWVTVIVRNSKKTAKHFEIGCEFEHTPPWNVLLLFG